MKPRHLISPIVATLVIGFWLKGQETSLHLIKERTRVLEERIHLVVSRDTSSIPSSETAQQEPSFVLPDGTVDWQALADVLADSIDPSKTLARKKIFQRMREILEGLSADKLESAYLTLDQLNLDPTQVDSFQRTLRSHFGPLNPEKALLFLGDFPFPHDDSRSDERRWYFTSFAQKDPEAAALWLDRHIEKGTLDTTVLDPLRNPRFDLEAALLSQLFRKNPAAAKDRIATFNAEERERVFDNPYLWRQEGKLPDDYLSLVRESLDEEKSTATIARAWSGIGFDGTARALKEMPFTQKEHSAIVDEVMQSYLLGEPAEERHNRAYTWLKEVEPSRAASSIAYSLNRHARSASSVEKAFQKSLELSKTFDDPEITTGFVKQFSTARGPGALDDPLREFKDPALAEQMRDVFNALPESSE